MSDISNESLLKRINHSANSDISKLRFDKMQILADTQVVFCSRITHILQSRISKPNGLMIYD